MLRVSREQALALEMVVQELEQVQAVTQLMLLELEQQLTKLISKSKTSKIDPA